MEDPLWTLENIGGGGAGVILVAKRVMFFSFLCLLCRRRMLLDRSPTGVFPFATLSSSREKSR